MSRRSVRRVTVNLTPQAEGALARGAEREGRRPGVTAEINGGLVAVDELRRHADKYGTVRVFDPTVQPGTKIGPHNLSKFVRLVLP